jgi:uracil-DNA glycosylase
VTAAVRCAPPDNKPLPPERDACAPFIRRELALLPGVRAILCLGGFAYEAAVRLIRDTGGVLPHPLPKFGHGVVVPVQGGPALVCSYHPSQQNTFTGRLTPAMLDDVLAIARDVIGGGTGAGVSAGG